MLTKSISRILFNSKRYFATSLSNRVIIETNELEDLIREDPDKVSILNASLNKPDYDARSDHIKERIAGSVFFDIEAISDPANPIPVMLPSLDLFQYHMKSLDVRMNDYIICYDKIGMLSAPRAYWMLKVFGAQNVYILNGTFSKWKSENRAIESEDDKSAFHRQRKTTGTDKDYDYKKNDKLVATFNEVDSIIDKKESVPIIDVRNQQMHERGRIPTSKCIPFTDVLQQDKTFKTPEELKELFKTKGGLKDPQNARIISACQKGIAACVVDAALRLVGNNNTQVYDGSYEEWSMKKLKKV